MASIPNLAGSRGEAEFPRGAPWESRLWTYRFLEKELGVAGLARYKRGAVSDQWLKDLPARFFKSLLCGELGRFTDPRPKDSQADFAALFGGEVSLCATSNARASTVHKGHEKIADALRSFMSFPPLERATTQFKPRTEAVLLLGRAVHMADIALRRRFDDLEMEWEIRNSLDKRGQRVDVNSIYNCSPLREVKSRWSNDKYCPETSVLKPQRKRKSRAGKKRGKPKRVVDTDFLLITHFNEEHSEALFGVPNVWAAQGCFITATNSVVELLGTPRWRAQLLSIFRRESDTRCRPGQAILSVRRCADGVDAWGIDKVIYPSSDSSNQ